MLIRFITIDDRELGIELIDNEIQVLDDGKIYRYKPADVLDTARDIDYVEFKRLIGTQDEAETIINYHRKMNNGF